MRTAPLGPSHHAQIRTVSELHCHRTFYRSSTHIALFLLQTSTQSARSRSRSRSAACKATPCHLWGATTLSATSMAAQICKSPRATSTRAPFPKAACGDSTRCARLSPTASRTHDPRVHDTGLATSGTCCRFPRAIVIKGSAAKQPARQHGIAPRKTNTAASKPTNKTLHRRPRASRAQLALNSLCLFHTGMVSKCGIWCLARRLARQPTSGSSLTMSERLRSPESMSCVGDVSRTALSLSLSLCCPHGFL